MIVDEVFCHFNIFDYIRSLWLLFSPYLYLFTGWKLRSYGSPLLEHEVELLELKLTCKQQWKFLGYRMCLIACMNAHHKFYFILLTKYPSISLKKGISATTNKIGGKELTYPSKPILCKTMASHGSHDYINWEVGFQVIIKCPCWMARC